ncbi:pyridoxamine 5'-phosphate oxidase family protein [Mycobacterium sp. 050272]|uniref:pyridoxamine 5'-phosphate oxidase family protein n=1 Tax=Mycobacteriaceae TaxID=1762 RepID=UPI00318D984A
MSILIPASIRVLTDGPNYAHLSTLSASGHPRNSVVWVAREDDNVLICTHADAPKAKDMRRDPRIGLSITAIDGPYRMVALQGQGHRRPLRRRLPLHGPDFDHGHRRRPP